MNSFTGSPKEKSNLFLQGAINTANKDIEDPEVKFFFKAPLNDGGTFCGIIDLTAKYGLVPKCVMPETYQSENSRLQGQIISTKLREFGLELRKMEQGKKKPEEITQEEKDDVKNTEKSIEEQRTKKNGIIASYAKNNKIVHQLIDLALLQNGMLKGAALDSFLKRSVDLIK